MSGQAAVEREGCRPRGASPRKEQQEPICAGLECIERRFIVLSESWEKINDEYTENKAIKTKV